jgi:hypothetical protein
VCLLRRAQGFLCGVRYAWKGEVSKRARARVFPVEGTNVHAGERLRGAGGAPFDGFDAFATFFFILNFNSY